jgi:outer membrane protein insertion porin family
MPAGEVPGQRDAQVSITEGQTGNIMLGAGVSTDAGLLGQLVYEERNFNIRDWPGSFGEFITGKGFRGAGQRLRIALEPGTEVSQYSISFTEPYLRNKPISLDVVASSWERDRESYEEGRLKGYVGFEKRYKNNWRRSISFRLEEVDVGDLDIDAPQEIRDVKGGNVLAGVNLGIGRDLTDDRLNPTKGYNFNISYEQVGGDHTFGILSGAYRRYKTIYEDLAERKTVLSTKLLGASVVGDAPPFEKFYGGGSGTYGIRGFEYRGVSTRGLQTNVARPKRKDPIGSDWIFLANAEVTVPLVSDNFAALFFVDSGVIDSGNYRAAVGTGIQILIPQWFGHVPMRFSIAAPIMKDGEDDTEVFSFSVGRLF